MPPFQDTLPVIRMENLRLASPVLLCNNLSRRTGVVDHSPCVREWTIQGEEIMDSPAVSTFNYVVWDRMAARSNTSGDSFLSKSRSSQPHENNVECVALGFAILQEWQK